MVVYIKNMVCDRCKIVVNTIFQDLNLTIKNITLGEVEIEENLDEFKLDELEVQLNKVGFDLLSDKKTKLIMQIKSLLIDLIQQNNGSLQTPLSAYIADKLDQDYHNLSQLFSQTDGTTIEQYYILLKIERVKELLDYNELSLKEIAFELSYSSVAHLSSQFKKVTGKTPTQYKTQKRELRKPLDNI